MSKDFRWDPEHYRPEFLRQARAVAKRPHKTLIEVADVSDGNHLTIAKQFSDEGVRYLRGQDLADFFISDADPVYIPERTYDQLARSHMRPGDVLIGVVGTIGSLGLVTKRHGKLTGSCKLAIVRPRELPGEYLAAYLASRPGQNEIQRRIRGAVQMGLILPDLKEIPVVIPSASAKKAIVAAVQGAESARQHSREVLEEAEDSLLGALGLDGLDQMPSLCYSRPFKDLLAARRFGAEYFMPAKARVLKALAAMPHRLVSDHFDPIKDLFQPKNARKGDTVRNYDVTDALDPFLDDTKALTPALVVGSTKKRFAAGDVVVSRLRSYLKEIAVVRTSAGVPSVGSSEFIVLRHKRGALSAETLLVFLRSATVQTILKWSQDGSNHPRFTEKDLIAIPVPEAVVKIAPKIDKLVNKSIAARQKSARLLDDAKRMVEEMVLGKAHRKGK